MLSRSGYLSCFFQQTEVEVTVIDNDTGAAVPNVMVCGFVCCISQKEKYTTAKAYPNCDVVWGRTDSSGKVKLSGRATYSHGVQLYIRDDYYHDWETVNVRPGEKYSTPLYRFSDDNVVEFPTGEMVVDFSQTWQDSATIRTRKKKKTSGDGLYRTNQPLGVTTLNTPLPFDIYAMDFLPPYGENGKIADMNVIVNKSAIPNQPELMEYKYRYEFIQTDSGIIMLDFPINCEEIFYSKKFNQLYEAPLIGYRPIYEDSFSYNCKTQEIIRKKEHYPDTNAHIRI